MWWKQIAALSNCNCRLYLATNVLFRKTHYIIYLLEWRGNRSRQMQAFTSGNNFLWHHFLEVKSGHDVSNRHKLVYLFKSLLRRSAKNTKDPYNRPLVRAIHRWSVVSTHTLSIKQKNSHSMTSSGTSHIPKTSTSGRIWVWTDCYHRSCTRISRSFPSTHGQHF